MRVKSLHTRVHCIQNGLNPCVICRRSGWYREGRSPGALLSNNADAQSKDFTAGTSTFYTAWGLLQMIIFLGAKCRGVTAYVFSQVGILWWP